MKGAMEREKRTPYLSIVECQIRACIILAAVIHNNIGHLDAATPPTLYLVYMAI